MGLYDDFKFSATRDTQDDSKSNKWFSGVALDDEPTAEPVAEQKDSGLISGTVDAVGEGFKSMTRAVRSFGNMTVGDNAEVEELAAVKAKQSNEQQAFTKGYADRNAAEKDAGLLDYIGNFAAAAWENPTGAVHATAEQFANAIPTLGAGYAGAKAGALAGGALGGGVGALPGAIVGGFLGMALGNTAIEGGYKGMQAAEGGLTDAEASQALREGAVKGTVIAGVDMATLGLGGAAMKTIGKTAVKAGAMAEAKVLMDAGVNVADKAALEAALRIPDLAKAAQAAGQVAAREALGVGAKAAKAGVGMGLETVGEGVGEYFGEVAATGKGDLADAVMEGFMGAGQSSIETAYNYNKTQGNEMALKGLLNAGSSDEAIAYFNTLQENLARPTEEAISPAADAITEFQQTQASPTLALPNIAGPALYTHPDGTTSTGAEMEQRRLDAMVQPNDALRPSVLEKLRGWSDEQLTQAADWANQSDFSERNEFIAVLNERGIAIPEKIPASGMHISGIDAALSDGASQLTVYENGKQVPFKNFVLTVDGNTATVENVERDASAPRGSGMRAYIELGKQLAAKGITLESTRTQLKDGQALWQRLSDAGYAQRNQKTGKGYEFVVPSNEAATQSTLEAEAAQQELAPTEAMPVPPRLDGENSATQQQLTQQESKPQVTATVGGVSSDLLSNEQLTETIKTTTNAQTRRAAMEVLNSRMSEPRVQDNILNLEGTTNGPQATETSVPPLQGQAQSSKPVPPEQNINALPLLGTSKIISRTKAKALQQIGRLTGTTIKFFHDKNDTSAEGFFRPKEDPNVVYINTAKPDLTMRRVFGHEVTHQLRTKHPKAWAEIEKVVRATMKPDTLVAMAEDYFSSKKDIITKLTGYKNQGKAEDFLKLTTAEAGYGQRFNDDNTEQTVEQLLMDELVSDLGGNRFGEEAFWEQVFQNILEKEGTEKGKGIIQRLMDSVIKMIKAFNAMMRDQNFKADELVDVDQVRTAMANAYATMIMENRGRDVGGELDASLGDETITQERALGGSVDAKEAPRRPEFTDQTLPTRWPTAADLTPSVDDDMITDIDTLKLDQTQYQQAVDGILEEPGFGGNQTEGMTLDQKAEFIVERLKDNLLWLFDQIPEAMRNRTKLWYDGARKIAEAWADKYELSNSQAAGMLAVLSPQKDWYMNVTMAERIVDVISTQLDHRFDKKMAAASFNFMVAKEEDPQGNAKKAKNNRRARENYAAIQGKTLREVIDSGDLTQIGMWIRAYDEAYHSGAYTQVLPEGNFGENMKTDKGDDARRAWGSFDSLGKAASIYMDGTPENINTMLGREHKVRNFYNNIFAPSDPRFTTIDTHAVAADMIRPLGGSAKPVSDAFGATGGTNQTGLSGTYALHYEAYRRAAELKGVLPREMQSITWEAVRGLFRDTYKTAENNEHIDGIWQEVEQGDKTVAQARAEILEHAGGIDNPTWWRSDDTTYETVLSDKSYAQSKESFVGQKLIFEVAPNPDDAAATDRWNALGQRDKEHISHEVAWKIIAKAMISFGKMDTTNMKGELHSQFGGYEDNTNPSYSIWLNKYISGSNVGKLLQIVGHALRQKEMMRTSPKPFDTGRKHDRDNKKLGIKKGDKIMSQEMDAIAITLPSNLSMADVDAIYQKLRAATNNAVGGHTTQDGLMIVLNRKEWSGLDGMELGQKIDAALDGEYFVDVGSIHVDFASKGKNDYDLPRPSRSSKVSGGARTEPSLRARADQLRADADAIIDQLVSQAEQRPDAASSGQSGAGAGSSYQASESRGVSATGIHYSKQERKSLAASMFGTGLQGAELERVKNAADERLRHRIYFYVNTGKGINPEFGVGPHAHKADLSNLYDIEADPQDLGVGADRNLFESRILDAGFDGFISQQFGAAVLIGPRNVDVEYLGTGVKPEVDQAGKAEASQYQKDLKAVAANMLLPSGQMKGSEWKTMVAKRMPSIDVSHLNDDEKYYKSGIVRKPMVQFSPSRAVDTNSPKFRKWFGDSKVVDADGKPLRVYHGTPNDFSDFDPDLSVEGGFFFTVDKDHASNFSGYKGTLVKPKNANVMPVHLSIQNPMVVSGRSIPKFHSVEDIENLINKAKAGRHDGVLIKNFNDGGAGKADTYIAFKPTQIKSALSNTGEYSDTNPDIRFSPSRELDFTQPDNMTLADMWLKLSEDADKSFIYKRTDEKDMVKLLNTLIPKAGAQEMESWFDSKLKPGQHLYRIDVKGKDAFVWVDDNRKEVWIDVSPLKGEGLGGQVYNAAANWAFNNDYVFVGDPYSISPAGMKRRIEHMVSSALKFRTSKHLAANEFMRNWFEEKIGKPLNDKNLQGWLEASYDMVKKDVPEAEDIVYNVKEKRYEWAEDGEAVGEGVIDAIAERTRGKIGAGSPGNRTLQKVFLSNTLLRGGDQGRALAEELRGGSRVLEGLDRKVLFSPSRVVDARDQSVPQIWYRGQVGAKAAEGPFYATAIGSPSFADSPEVASTYAMNPEAAGLYGINQRPPDYADNSNVAPYKITGKLYDARSLQGGHGTKTGLTPKAVRRVLKDLGLGENDVMIDFAGKYGRGKSAFWDAAEYDIPESRKILAAHTLFDQPAVREVLEEKGYAGVIFNGSLSEQNTRNDVPWDEAIVHGELRAVKKGSLQSAISPDILYSPPRFFSQLERSVDQIPKKLSTGKEIALWLKGNAGKLQVKKEELEWTGVLDWLDTQKKVTPDDVRAYLSHSGVQVQDVVLGGETGLTSAQKERLDELENNGDRTNEEDAEFQRLIRIENDADGKTDDTKFSQYQLEGDKSDYRELLITLPAVSKDTFSVQPTDVVGDYFVQNDRTGAEMFFGGESAAKAKAIELNATAKPVERKVFGSSHFDEPNILAHIRMNERTDAEGKRVLFLEEIQSDWGQKGKKEGFNNAKLPSKPATYGDIVVGDRIYGWGQVQAIRDGASGKEFDVGGLWITEGKFSIDKVESRDTSMHGDAVNQKGVPSAPFVTDTQAWTGLALKRAIMWAVQNGHDAIAFTTGAQQAERYDLSKQVDEIIFWGPDADGDITPDADEVGISIYGKGGAAIKEQEIVKHSDLEDLIGKELAQRIIDGDAPQAEGQPQGVKTLSGLDLKVGGTGMIAYYDRILPDTLRKVLRQVGAGDTAVEQIVMERGHEMEHPETGETVETQDETQPGIILSDKLKEAVSAGVPLFSLPRNLQGQPINAAWSNDLNLESWDYVKRQLLDKLVDTKHILGEIRKAGVAIKDAFDPYLQETLYHGRAAKGVADFAESELKPLIAEMHLKGIEMQELEDYLWARHAGERNAQVASIGGMADGGSGLTNAEAAAILSGQAVTKNGRTIQIRTAKMPAYQTLAQKVKAINDSTLDLLVAEGLETQATVNAWKAAYSNYVPLKRDMESDDNFLGAFNLGSGTGQGFSVKGSASKRALGSNRAVIDILANVAMQRERAIVRAEKNKIAMATYGLALTAPNPEFWIPINPKGDVTDIVDQLVKMGVAPQQARQYADNLAQQPTTQTVNSQGVVTSTPMPFLAQRPDVMSVRVNGEDRFLMFSSDEKGQQMVRNLKNLDAEQMGVVMSNIAKVTRYFAAINTAYNPIFGLTNFIRDSGSALLNLSSTPLAGKQGEVAGNVTSALRGVFSDLRAHRDGRPATSVWAQEFEEFQKEGGQTGYMDSFSNSTERAKAIRDELTSLDKSKWLKLGDKNPVLGLLSDYNTAIENAWRLSAYKVAKQSGMSKQQAAALAKSLTVNFNRKGLAATQLGALFAFFNAAVQGSARIAETMVKDGKLTPAGQKIILGGLIAGSAQALMFAAAGWDDEEPPQFIREKNFIIPLANGKYVAIPYPLGYHVIPNLGRVSTEFVLGGFKKPADRIIQLAMSVVDGFNPLGSSSIAQTIAPTIADPIIAMAENKDFTGKNIFKEDFNKMKPTAGWTRTKDTASDLAKGLSYGINYATGGGKYGIGALSPTPDQIDYLIGQATGGVGREANKLYQAGKTVVSGEELPEYKIPVAGRFYGSTTGQASQASRFYSNLKMIGQHASTVKEMTEAKDFDSRSEYLKEHAAATMIDRADKVSREIGYLKRMKREAIENGDSEKVKQLESRITTKMALFNDVVKAKVK